MENKEDNIGLDKAKIVNETQKMCNRCENVDSVKTGYCVCECNTSWKKNKENSILPIVVTEPKIWKIQLCPTCISKAYMEDLKFSIKTTRNYLILFAVLLPISALLLVGLGFLSVELGLGANKANVLYYVIGILFFICFVCVIVSIIMIPVKTIKLIKLKIELANPANELSDTAFFKALKAEGRRIVDVLKGEISEHLEGNYALHTIEFEDIPDEIKKTISNNRTEISYNFLHPALSFEGVIKQVSVAWKKKLINSSIVG